MTDWAVPDRDTLRRIIFQLQRPDWRVHSPVSDDSTGGHVRTVLALTGRHIHHWCLLICQELHR